MADPQTPRITPDLRTAEISGLDHAMIIALGDEMADAYEAGLYDRDQLRTAVRVLHEALGGGPLMTYFAHAKLVATKAVASIAEVDPTNVAEIIRVQQDIRAFHSLLGWMSGFIGIVPRSDRSDSDDQPTDA